MGFYPEERDVPARLVCEDVLIRPIRASDAEADYQALISSREMLRVWDQSDWPADDFTIDENRAELAEHEADHQARTAFTFTVMDRAEQRCLGCVYLYALGPILEQLGVPAADRADVNEPEAYVTFWVRESEVAREFDRELLAELLRWFDAEWAFQRIALGTNTADVRQQSLFRDAGFAERWRAPVSGRDSAYLVYVRQVAEAPAHGSVA